MRILATVSTYSGDGVRVSKTSGGDTTQYVLNLAATPPVVISDTDAAGRTCQFRGWMDGCILKSFKPNSPVVLTTDQQSYCALERRRDDET